MPLRRKPNPNPSAASSATSHVTAATPTSHNSPLLFAAHRSTPICADAAHRESSHDCLVSAVWSSDRRARSGIARTLPVGTSAA
jgi:hypothetical protein